MVEIAPFQFHGIANNKDPLTTEVVPVNNSRHVYQHDTYLNGQNITFELTKDKCYF